MTFLSRIAVVILIVCLQELTCQQHTHIPCSNLFQIIVNSQQNRYYGIVTIPPPIENQWNSLNVSMGHNGEVFSNDRWMRLGQSREQTANNARRGLNIQYTILIPASTDPPIVKFISLNGKILCKGPDGSFQNNWSFRSNFFFGSNQVISEHSSNTEEIYHSSADWLFAHQTFPLTSKPTVKLAHPTKTNKPPGMVAPKVKITVTKPTNISNDISEMPMVPDDGSWLKNYMPMCGKEVMPDTPNTPTIFNGVRIAKGEFPWLVLLYLNKVKASCGASLVSEKFVITAGHCVKGQKVEYLEFGRHDTNAEEEGIVRRKPKNVILHHTYVEKQVEGDIALIEFEPVSFTNKIRPVCLWPFGKLFDKEEQLDFGTVAGWGRLETGEISSLPMKTYVDIVDKNKCKESHNIFKMIAKDQTFCAGGKSTGPCHGDSGGGFYLMHNHTRYLRGIISHALVDTRKPDFCLTDFYAVYVDISYYLNWLKQYLLP